KRNSPKSCGRTLGKTKISRRFTRLTKLRHYPEPARERLTTALFMLARGEGCPVKFPLTLPPRWLVCGLPDKKPSLIERGVVCPSAKLGGQIVLSGVCPACPAASKFPI